MYSISLSREYTIELDLKDSYPFFPPKIHLEVGPGIISPYELKNINLDDILGEQWSPCINLLHVAEKCGEFMNQYLAFSDDSHGKSWSPLWKFFCYAKGRQTTTATSLFLLAVAILMRYGIALAGYSGEHNPPEYGDFEVHRHWMELGVSLPPSDWYQESEKEYAYKGVDYPPFCMYVHYIFGTILKYILPESVQYMTSRGYESETLKILMRSTVVLLDIGIFCSGILCFILYFYKNIEYSHKFCFAALAMHIPCLLLIDHGHFHYNCVMLGLCLWSIIFILNKQYVTGTILYCLALNFKQMCLYYSISFFFFVIARIVIESREVFSSYIFQVISV